MVIGNFTLTGTYLNPNGAPDSGKVKIESIPSIVVDSGGNHVFTSPLYLALNAAGSFSTTLPSDSSSGSSTAIGYRVTKQRVMRLDSTPVTFFAPAIGATLDMASVTSQAVVPVVTGAATLTDLAGKVDKGTLVINIKDYGATGNGTTDDTTAINTAITAAGTGGRLYAPVGTYLTTGGHQLLAGQTLAGSGSGTVFKQKTNANANWVIGVISVSNVTLRDFKVDGNKANQTAGNGRGVDTFNTADTRLQGLDVTATRNEGIILEAADGAEHRITVDNVNVYLTGSRCLSTTAIKRLTVVNSRFRGPVANENIRIDTSSGVVIANNHVDVGATRQMVIQASSDVTVHGNHLTGGLDDCICIQGTDRSTVTGNLVRGAGSVTNVGPGITFWNGATHGVATGNTVSACGQGIIVDGSPSTPNNSDIAITSNVVTGCDAGVGSDAATGVVNARVLIMGNQVTSCTTTGIYIKGNTDNAKAINNYAISNGGATQVTDSTTGRTGNVSTPNYTT